ncbi:hypothetical protein GALL_125140 [mine drainage metagenome]|uniref:Outer membrane protein beta-barrel domain-containing protein n=1 Tax=mine drainage metagenome TaxID=410659 RepID=A0A1J5SZQ5_9ZZZZ
MKNKLYIIPIVFLFFYSCNIPRYVYSPAPPNINYFKQKGDIKLVSDYSFGDQNIPYAYNDGLDMQGGYAFTNHFALIASYYYRSEKDNYYNSYNFNNPPTNDTTTVAYKRHFFELGVGYFLSLNKKKTITYNLYGGVALGSFKINEYDSYNNSINIYNYNNNMTKVFLQSGINFMLSPSINFSFTDRLVSVVYGNPVSSFPDAVYPGYYLNYLNKKSLTALEHTTNFQFGIPKIKWMKIDATFTLCFSDGVYNLKTRPFNGSIGLAFDLTKLKKSKK